MITSVKDGQNLIFDTFIFLNIIIRQCRVQVFETYLYFMVPRVFSVGVSVAVSVGVAVKVDVAVGVAVVVAVAVIVGDKVMVGVAVAG